MIKRKCPLCHRSDVLENYLTKNGRIVRICKNCKKQIKEIISKKVKIK